MSKEKGFSLIELLIVMVILGLLAALVGPKLIDKGEKSKPIAAKDQIRLFEAALDLYRLEVGKYPTTAQGLQALRVRPPGVEKWGGPYLRYDIPADPWGNIYSYKCPGDHADYDITSLGADGAPGGEGLNADVTNWKSLD